MYQALLTVRLRVSPSLANVRSQYHFESELELEFQLTAGATDKP